MKKIIVFVCLIFSTMQLFANEKVVLQLKWFHQFQFAGYYAAKEKGFFKELGLDVEIRERDLQYNNIEEVIDNKAQYGVADSILMLYRAKNEPVVLVTPILQYSPTVLLTLKSNEASTIYDLDSKRMLFYPNDTDGFTLLALFKQLNISPNLIRERQRGDYKKLLSKEVDAIPSYLSNEPYYFRQMGVDINIINPAHYGFDLLGDMLFTNSQEAKNHPNRVKKFKEAVLKGWRYALENQEEMVQLIHKKYNSAKSLEHLRYEAKVIEQMVSMHTLPLGSLDQGRVRYIFDLFKKYDLLQTDVNVSDFIFEEYQKNFSKLNLNKEERAYIEENPLLKVQNIPNFPPFNFNENGQAKGFIVDYMRLIAKALGVEVQFVPIKTWSESLEQLADSKIDIIPQIVQNTQRESFITFTNTSQTQYTPSIVVKKNSTIRTLNDLKGKTVAVVNKSFLHTLIKKKYPELKLYLSSGFKENLEVVSSGKVDASIENLALVQFLIQKEWLNNVEVFTLNELETKELKMGVEKSNTVLKSLLEKANAIIEYEALASLRQKWMNTYASDILLTPKELSFLKRKKELIACVQKDYKPFESVQNGKHLGMTSEYLEIVSNELPISIKTRPISFVQQGMTLLKNGQCDFVTLAEYDIEKSADFNFSNIYLDEQFALATLNNRPYVKSLNDLKGKKIGVFQEVLDLKKFQVQYPNVDFVPIESISAGLDEVVSGNLYGVIDMFSAVGYHIQNTYFDELKIAGKLEENKQLAMLSSVNEPMMNQIINKLLQSISKEEYKQIERNWLWVKYEEQIDYTLVILLVLFFAVVILIVLYKNQSINKINQQMEKYIDIIDENVLTSSTDLKGNITYVSQAFCDISGYTKKELLGKKHNIVRHPDMPKELFKELWETISNDKIWAGEMKNRRKDGSFYWVEATITPLYDLKGKKIGYTAIRNDISDKKIIEEISITDGMTNIFNRRHFNDIFPKYINSAKRKNELVSFLIMDVDHFKQYNDTYGHQKGDDVLKNIAKTLQNSLNRADDYCFRLGGEEFGVLFKEESKDKALEFAHFIKENIEALHIKHQHNSASDYVTVSMGLYSQKADLLDDEDEIFKNADDMLYKAKESGRNRVQAWS